MEISKIEGISSEQLHRYVEMRRRVDGEANIIHRITSMLALLETCGVERFDIDPIALGQINQMLNTNIMNFWKILDDFISLVHAQSELERVQRP